MARGVYIFESMFYKIESSLTTCAVLVELRTFLLVRRTYRKCRGVVEGELKQHVAVGAHSRDGSAAKQSP